MDGYILILILIGLFIIIISANSIKKDLERADDLLKESKKRIDRLSQLLNESVDTIEELDAFSEYVIDRIEQKVKWAREELKKDKVELKADIVSDESRNTHEEDLNNENEEKIIRDETKSSITQEKDNKILSININGVTNKGSDISKDEIYKKVFEMYNSGLGLDEIAYKLQIGKGEAALALKIMRRKSN